MCILPWPSLNDGDDAKRHEVMCLVRQVYFAPSSQDNVGMLDVVSKQFSTVYIGCTIHQRYNCVWSSSMLYWDAAAAGTKVRLCRLSGW